MPDHTSFSSSSSISTIGKLRPGLEAGSLRLDRSFSAVFSPQNHREKLARPKNSSSYETFQRNEKLTGWRPWTLRPPILILVAFLTMSMVIFLGILQRFSDRHGGLFFANQISDLAAGPTFLYLYFPTLLAVLFSTGWNWIDLDSKRLEPWFQLAEPEGASAENSILLQYPIDFLAFVPIKAARRKQWAVLCVSSIMVLVFWAITPLQSGIFAVKSISKSSPRSMVASPSLSPLAKQVSTLDVGFLNSGYGAVWLDQKLPTFTTSTYALAPFGPPAESEQEGSRTNLTWTSTTTLYGTDLECSPATVSLNKTMFAFNFDNGRGCNALGIVPHTGTASTTPNPGVNAYYIPYYADNLATTRTALSTSGCTADSSHEFLAVWKRVTVGQNFRNSSAFTASFCRPTYFSQPVQATVALPDRSVMSAHPIGPRSPMTDRIFNITHFEYIIGTGVPPGIHQNMTSYQDPIDTRYDIAGTSFIDQSVLLRKRDVVVPTSNMVGFALGKNLFNPEELLNSTTLHSAFRAAHQLLFALAIQSVIQAPGADQPHMDGVESYVVEAVSMVKVFTLLVQGFLSVVVLGTVYLAFSYHRRRTTLNVDPASISTLMCFTHNGHELMNHLKTMDRTDGNDFPENLKGIWTKATYFTEQQQPTLDLVGPMDHNAEARGHWRASNSSQGIITPESLPHVRPLELKAMTGLMFSSVLAGAVCVLLVLHSKIMRENGIPLPSESTVVQQLLTNYLPVAFGTLIEPVWVVLNRLLCIIQPFEELRNRPSEASRSISLRYTSLPPQLVVWRALRARHFLLASLCTVAIFANILTVALSGLFTLRPVIQHQDIVIKQEFFPQLAPQNQSLTPSGQLGGPIQIVISNISEGNPLPSWVSTNNFFVPVGLPSGPIAQDLIGYNITTVGIGAVLDCKELHEGETNFAYQFDLSSDVTQANFSMTYEADDKSIAKCYASIAMPSDIDDDADAPDTQVYLLGSPVGARALEMLVKAQPSYLGATAIEKETCPNLIIGGWIRSKITLEDKTSETINGPTANASTVAIDKTFMACTPRIRSALFNVTVDRNGIVLASTKLQTVNQSVVGDMTAITNATTYQLANVGASKSFLVWHNDSFTSDWVSFLIKEVTHSTAITDPYARVPQFNETASNFNEVYQRVFAATMGANSGFLAAAPDDALLTITQATKETRIFMSEAMFRITLSILLLDLVVAIALYTFQARAFLPRLPTSIASILAYVAASHMISDLDKLGGRTYAEKMEYLEHEQQRYRFGKYLGTDRKSYIGIDHDEYAVHGGDEEKQGGSRLRWPWRGASE